MSIFGRIDGSDPARPEPLGGAGPSEREIRPARSGVVAEGTIACPTCDAPVALLSGPVAPADPLECPFCGHAGHVRDFLSLGHPTRPTHVEVRIVARLAPTR